MGKDMLDRQELIEYITNEIIKNSNKDDMGDDNEWWFNEGFTEGLSSVLATISE